MSSARAATGTTRPTGTAGRVGYALTKVSEATATFWVIKIITTGMGEVVADDGMGRFGIPLTASVSGVAMVAALVWQFRQDRYRAWPYWTAAAMVSVFGTTVGDAPRRYLGLNYIESSIIFAAVVAVILGGWYATERTLSIHAITSRRREGFYWATVGATFALGTAAGDLATALGSPFLVSALGFGALMAVAYLGHRFTALNGVLAFWFAYVMTRPLGASVADWTWVPPPYGAGLSKGLVAIVSIVAFLALCTWIAKTRNGEPETLEAEAAQVH